MRLHEFRGEIWLPLPPDEVFPFFCDAANLDAITPPWLKFSIASAGPVEMRAGAVIEYRLRVHGLPMRWRALIREWQPPHRFVDEQLRGPYLHWIHEHSFEAQAGGTLARDFVRYAVPMDFLVHPLFVRRDIEQIFAYRQKALQERLGGATGNK